MPQVIELSGPPYEPAPNRKQWTRRECSYLQDSGLLTGRYELVDGEIISKMGQKPPHRSTVLRIRNWLMGVFGGMFVQSQSSIDVADEDNDHNEPEPDVAVTTQPDDVY